MTDEPQTDEGARVSECVHGHRTKQVGCVSCELLHRHSPAPLLGREASLRALVEKLRRWAEEAEAAAYDDTHASINSVVQEMRQESDELSALLASLPASEGLQDALRKLERDHADLREAYYRAMSEPALQQHFRLFGQLVGWLNEQGKHSHAAGVVAAEEAMQIMWRQVQELSLPPAREGSQEQAIRCRVCDQEVPDSGDLVCVDCYDAKSLPASCEGPPLKCECHTEGCACCNYTGIKPASREGWQPIETAPKDAET